MYTHLITIGLLLPFMMNSYMIAEENPHSSFQSKMTSKEPYEAENNPIPFLIEFSEVVQEINPSFFLTTNCQITSFAKISDLAYQGELTVEKPGFVFVTLSDKIRSKSAASLQAIPTLSFSYQGVIIHDKIVTKVTETEARFELTCNKPAMFYSYITSSSIIPSKEDILRFGQQLQMISSTHYYVDFHSLQPATRYFVYTTGKEKSGLDIGTNIHDSNLSFYTRNSRGEIVDDYSEKTYQPTCPVTMTLNSNGEVKESVCNNHGFCDVNACKCESGYSGTDCSFISTSLQSTITTSSHLLHGFFILSIRTLPNDGLLTYLKNSIHEAFTAYCSVSLSDFSIRNFTILHKTIPTPLSLKKWKQQSSQPASSDLFLRFTLTVDKTNSLLYKELLENDQLQPEIQSNLKSRGIQLLSLQRKRVVIQTSQDHWSCHNGVKEKDEGDVDCGGDCLKKCSEKQSCNSQQDCESRCFCNHGICEINNNQFFASDNNIIPVISLCCVTVCIFLIVGTFISHNNNNNKKKQKQAVPPFEQLKDLNV